MGIRLPSRGGSTSSLAFQAEEQGASQGALPASPIDWGTSPACRQSLPMPFGRKGAGLPRGGSLPARRLWVLRAFGERLRG